MVAAPVAATVVPAEEMNAAGLAFEKIAADRMSTEDTDASPVPATVLVAGDEVAGEVDADSVTAEQADAARVATDDMEPASMSTEEAHDLRMQSLAAVNQLWTSLHGSATDGLDETASAKCTVSLIVWSHGTTSAC